MRSNKKPKTQRRSEVLPRQKALDGQNDSKMEALGNVLMNHSRKAAPSLTITLDEFFK